MKKDTILHTMTQGDCPSVRGRHLILVESALTYTTDVRIVNLAGMTINAFTIEPGETIETRINNSGVYIVEPSEARFIKKLSVR